MRGKLAYPPAAYIRKRLAGADLPTILTAAAAQTAEDRILVEVMTLRERRDRERQRLVL